MSRTEPPGVLPEASAQRRARRNVGVLFFAQAVLGAQMPVNIILGGLAGAVLAENPSFATLPVSFMVVASMLAAAPASLLMGRFGRRAGFLLGTLAGGASGAVSAQALYTGSFGLLLFGAALGGIYHAFQGFYRFAAADTAPDAFKPKAISWVLAGGLLSALIGPEIVRSTADYFAPVPFAGAYATLVVVNLIGAIGLLFLDIPRPPRSDVAAGGGRSLGEIFSQPRAIVAVLCAMIAYALMSLVMTSTPLAMVGHGYSADHAADVVRWHVFAMFAPSFFTGSIIARFGHLRVIAAGMLLLGACGGIALLGVELDKFYLALIMLGFGWNFAFIGGTSLLAESHTAEERAKVQGLNDLLVYGLVAVASFSSGALLHAFGWSAVQWSMLPAIVVALAAVTWLGLRERGAAR